MRKLKKLKICLILFLLVTFTACGNQNAALDGAGAAKANKITVGAYITATDNPLDIKASYNEPVNLLIYDSLFTVNDKFEANENLAKELIIENNARTVNITIKPNVKFHDGSPLTAYDVEATINYILKNGGYYAYSARNFESVSAISDYSLKINLKFITPNIKLQLTFPILCKKQLLDLSNFTINGTGPYKLSSETKGKLITLAQNTEYHQSFKSDIKMIEIDLIPDNKTAYSLSSSGILDAFYSSFYDDGIKTVTKYQSYKNDYLTDEYTFIAINYENPILRSKQLRKAISLAISREKIVSDIYMTHAKEAYMPIMPDAWAYNGSSSLQRDIISSKKLLSDAGFFDIDNSGILERTDENNKKQQLRLNILCADNFLIKKSISESVALNLKEVGIDLSVVTVSMDEYKRRYNDKKYDLCLVTADIGKDLDLYEFLDPSGKFFYPTELDFASYQQKFAYTEKRELKQPTYMRLCDDFYDSMPHIPLLFLKNTLITSSKLESANKSLYPIDLFYKTIRRD